MKRILGVVVALAMVAGVFAVVEVSAVERETLPGGFVVKGTVLVDYIGDAEHVVIPEGVTAIGSWAFNMCTSLKSISVPEGVETIGYATFAGCRSLKTVNIPNSVFTIEGGSFYGCDSLKFLYIPASVTEIIIFMGPTFNEDTTLIVNKDSYAHWWADYKSHDQGWTNDNKSQPYIFAFVSSFDSMFDVFNMLKLIMSDFPISAEQKAVADLNGDNNVNAADVLAAMKYVVSL